MNNEVGQMINQAVKNIIEHTGDTKTIKKLIKKHDKKIHFIPKRYRVLSGILQSMNIQFGNFIEELMAVIIQQDGRYEIIKEYSGKKDNHFHISRKNDEMIDNYITRCQIESNFDLEKEFAILYKELVCNRTGDMIDFKHDIDLLFKDKITNVYYYLEIKYNDDHDTGKFVDINRKFIKTAGYLANELNVDNVEQFKPILFFFNNKKMKGNIYIPEETNIYRGKRFFDEFLTIPYDSVESYMSNLSESDETIQAFNDLYNKVMSLKEEE